MELKKLLVAMTAASAAMLTACGGDSSSSNNTTTPTTPTVTDNTCSVGVGKELDTTYSVDGVDMPVCLLSGSILTDATLTTDYVYSMTDYVTVGDGAGELTSYDAPSEVTLTINPGVAFRSTSKGTLIISRGSKINANGTAEAPIVMSSIDDNYEGNKEWGGLVVQGFAKNNQCANEYAATPEEICNTADEADTGFHGGNDDADNSGSISYLIVAEGGYEVVADSEINGITMHSVGYGTTVENVMVYNNYDDGIEFFGGSVNVKHLILVDNGDESIDWDDGYRGNIQFSLVRQGVTNAGDNGIEADNAGLSNTAEPVSNPTLSNITFQTASEGSAYLMRAKVGTYGTLTKIAADNYAKAFRIADTETTVVLTDSLVEYTGMDAEDTLRLENSATEGQITGWGASSTSDNVALGNAFEVTGGNGSVTASTATSANASTGFFEETDYIGAVDPTVTAAESAWWAWAADVIPAAFETEE